MMSLYESILKSTNSGRSSLPLEFSEFYTPKECAKAIKDFCKYYQIKDSKLMVQIEKTINCFVETKTEIELFVDSNHKLQSHSFNISKFRFVKDKDFKNKLLTRTNASEIDLNAYSFDTQRTLFLIFQAEFSKKKIWYHLHLSSIFFEVGEGSYLEELLKKYENR